MQVGVIYTNNNITIIKDGETKTLSVGDALFEPCLQLWKNKDLDGIVDLLWSTKKIVEKAYGEFGFKVQDGVVFINNKPVVDSLGQRIISYAERGESPDRLVLFWNRLINNTSYWCVQSLFDFLDRNRCPIGEDGRFMALKAVDKNFKDKKTGTINNSPGTKVPPFDRNQVDDDRLKACSFGYHVGSATYVKRFGDQTNDKFIEVLVDPADVVSIPEDVMQDKIRVCTYEVVREVPKSEVDYIKYNDVYNNNNAEEYDDDNY